MESEEKTTRTKLRWLSAFAIIFLICMTALIMNSDPYQININMTSDDNTKDLMKQMVDLSDFQNCIDKCKYIDGKYDQTKEEAYECFYTCEHE